MIGQTFGRLLVTEQALSFPDGKIAWLCKCDCGNNCIIRGGNLQSGNTHSCGCLQKEIAFKNGKRWKGKNNPFYNNGLGICGKPGNKRWYITCRNGSRIAFARAVWEGETGIRIPKGGIIHHINHDSTFDEIQNLAMFFSQAAHKKYHKKLERRNKNVCRNQCSI